MTNKNISPTAGAEGGEGRKDGLERMARLVRAEGLKLSRRGLLEGATLAGAALALGGAGLLAGARDSVAATLPGADFLRLSVFLTGGQPLDATLAGRYQAALAKRDPQFADGAQALLGLIGSSKAANIDELLAAPELKDALRALTTRIVSAWYLGIVGEDADAELISYANALMYRPTADVLIVPSYGAGPDSWGDKPGEKPGEKPAATATANEHKTS